jgi:type I restriction enzyme M protein
MSVSKIINKVWNFAHLLRDGGVGYVDDVELKAFLIFLKMAHERRRAIGISVPSNATWPSW